MSVDSHSSLASLPFGKITKWRITFVDPINGHIFCQLLEASVLAKYKQLKQTIKLLANSEKLEKRNAEPIIGELCLAKSSVNETWYRSQITDVNQKLQCVEVYYLDCGISDTIPFESLRDLPSQFYDIPAFAHECILADIEPVLNNNKWDEHAIELIQKLVLNCEVDGIAVRLHKRGIIVIKLYSNPEALITVGDQLIASGFALPKQLQSITGSASNSLINQNTYASGSGSDLGPLVKSISNVFPMITLSPGNYIEVCVVFFNSLKEFYCQPAFLKDKLVNLQKNLQHMYAKSLEALSVFEPNQPCCAKFYEDDQWYRALIKSVERDTCNLFFVDYGNTEVVNKSDIKELKSDFCRIPSMAFRCLLSGIEPLETKFSEEADCFFQKVADQNTDHFLSALIKKVSKDFAEVILYDYEGNSINQIMVNEKLVASSPERVNQSLSSQSVGFESNLTSIIRYISPNLNIGIEETIFITTSFTPHKFFVHLAHSSEKLNQLMDDIQTVYKNSGNTDLIKNPVVGLQCVTIFSEDDKYYRAEIQKIDKYEAQVLFVDYGNSELKALNELKSLRKEFIKLPRQAVECRLAGIELIKGSSVEFSYEVCQKFEELTMDKTLTMNVLEFSNGVYKVSLFDSSNGQQINVANELLSSGFSSITGLPKKDYGKAIQSIGYNYKELSVDVNSFFDVVPVNVVDPNYFFCHVVQSALEFKKLTETINEFYQSENVVNQNMIWEETMPCIALFDEDQKWYRALVLSSVDKNSLEILFVDFGNTATVSITSVYPIYEEFMKLPMQVFLCSLDVVPKQKTWISEAVEVFQNLVLDKHLGAFVKEKRGQLYSIVLYDTRSSPEINVGQLLLQKGYTVTQLANQSITEFCLPFNTEDIYVTAVISSTEVYAQLERVTSELDTLMNDINGFYSKLSATDMCITIPVVGQYCCAKFSEDDAWYRAIIEDLNGNYFSVFYIDYGNKEFLPIERIKILDSQFLAKPKFALPCQVNGSYDSSDLLDKRLKVEFTTNFEEITPFKVMLFGTVKKELLSNSSIPCIPAKKFDIAPTNFKPGDEVKMYFLEAVSPESFYCQPASSENQLNVLMNEIADYVKSGKCCSTNIAVGCYYLVNYSADGMWYRAQIISKSDVQVEVRFCDYGNIDVVKPSKILDLPYELSTLSQQAILCSLYGVKPSHNKWTNGAVEMLSKILSGKELKVTFVSTNSKSLVKVKDIETDQDIADQLIASGFAISSCSDSHQVKNHLSGTLNQNYIKKQSYKESYAHSEYFLHTLQIEAASADPPLLGESEQVIHMLPQTDITRGFYECTCYAIESGFKIYCQLSSLSGAVDKLMSEIARVADGSPVLMNPMVDQLCLAKYVVDNVWYRGRIIAVDEDVLVDFIDYGNVDNVPLNDVRVLPAAFATVARASVGVVLHDVIPSDLDSSAAKKWLEETLLEAHLRLEVKEVVDPSTVSAYVYELESSASINDQLYALHALPEGDSSSLQIEAASADPPLLGESEQVIHMLPQTDITRGFYECTCYAIESGFKIYCQLSSLSGAVDKLMSEIARVADGSPVLMNPMVDQLCLAKYVVDNVWYRGRIIAVDEDVLVDFIDYGNVDNVPLNDVRVLPAAFATVARASVGVVLHDVIPSDLDSSAAKKWLEETLLEAHLRLEVKEVVDPSTVSAYVYELESSASINDQLYALHALPEGDSSSLQIEAASADPPLLGESEQVIHMLPQTDITRGFYECTCYAIESGFKIYCQLSSLSGAVDKLMSEIARVADGSPVLMNPMVDQLCLAKYVVDNVWYRGRIIAVDEDVLVDFIDYGNVDNVPLNDVRVLPAAFATVARASVGVVLHDVIPSDLDSSAAKKWLEETLLEAHLRLEVKEVVDPSTVSAYVYELESSASINDQLYALHALPEGDSSSLQIEAASADPPLLGESEQVIHMLPQTDITRGFYECTCYAIESGFKIYCQLSSLSGAVDKLMSEIARVADGSPVLMNPMVDQLCLAKYVVDNVWYRGRIIAVDEDVLVDFIDYGNVDNVPLNDVRVLPAAFATVARASVGVVLHDVIPSDLDSSAAKKWLEETLLEAHLRLEVKEVVDPSTVSAYVYELESSASINDQLYALHALPEGDSSSLQIEAASADPPLLGESEQVIHMLPQTDITRGFYECTCYAIESGFKIYCQLSSLSGAVDKLMSEIARVADGSPVLMNPMVDQLCLAKYVVDNVWYRGRIIAVDEDVLVDFIDYGNVDNVPLNDVRVLPAAFATVARASVGVVLHDVIPSDLDSSAAKKWLEETLLEAHLRLEVKEVVDPSTVSAYVYELESSASINDQLYALHALPEGDSSSLQIEAASADPPLLGESEQVIHMLPQTDITRGFYECTCYAIESGFKIYCQLSSLSGAVDKLMSEIARVADGSPVLMNPMVDQLCLAKYVVDNVWYRGRIIAVDEDVLVDFIDYGNVDNVPLNDVRVLPAAFATVARASVGVVLHDVIPSDLDSSAAKKWLEETLLEAHLRLEVKEVVDPSTVSAYVYELESSASINDQLYALHALPEGDSSSLQIEAASADPPLLGESEQVIHMLPQTDITRGFYECTCYAIESGFKIYCQLSSLSGAVDKLMSEIARVADGSPVLMNPMVDQLCLAKYVVDNVWYRGRIIAVDEDVLVDFIDYGNVDNVPLNDVRVLPAAFATVARASVGVVLHDVIPSDLDSSAAKKWLEETLLEAHLRLEVKEVVDPSTVSAYVYELESSASINDQLYALHALPEGDSSSLQIEAASADPPLLGESEQVIHMLPQTDITRGFYECTCYAIESGFKIYCQLSSLSGAVDKLMSEIARVADGSPVLMNPMVDQLCLAKYVVDNVWYRGRIIAVDEDVLVDFIDYGNVDNVPLNDVRVLPAAFATVARASVGVVLHDVIPSDLDSSAAKKWLEETLLEAHLRLEVKEVVDPSTVSAYVYELESSASINDQLYALHALPEGDSSSLQIEAASADPPLLGESEQVIHMLPQTDITRGFYECTCYAIESGFKIYCQLSSLSGAVDKLMSEIARVADGSPVLMNPMVDQLCLAKYVVDNVWYRGRIIAVDEDVLVDFIDYGNVDNVPLNDVRVLPAAFATVARASVGVVLHDVIPSDLDSSAAKKWLEETLLEAHLRLEVKEVVDPSTVSAYVYELESSASINDQLYALHALPEGDSSSLQIEAASADPPLLGESEQVIHMLPQTDITRGFYECTCYAIESGFKIYCQLSSLSGAVDKLMSEIARVADGSPVLMNPMVDQLCLAKYVVDNVWYRGRIIAVDEDVLVDFIDYGNVDNVPLNDVRVLPAAFATVARASVGVVLHDVIPSDLDSSAAKKWLEETLLEAHLRLEVKEVVDPSTVSAYVYELESSASINDQLYALHALPEGDSSSLQIEAASADPPLLGESEQVIHMLPQTDITRGFYECTCYAIESGFKIYCQLSSLSGAVDKLMSEIARVADGSPVLMNPMVDQLCLAKYVVDNVWYRGRIIAVDEDVLVDFIDYGNVDNVPLNDVRVLPAAFATVARASVGVVLHDVIPSDLDSSAAKKWLEETLLEAHLRLEVKEVVDPSTVSAYVYEFENAESINDQVYQLYAPSNGDFKKHDFW